MSEIRWKLAEYMKFRGAQRLRYELDNLERVIGDAESGWQKFIASSLV